MLGRIALVSMSDKRLGGTENSSLRYLSAMRALDVSTSRIVRPSFSRRVRRLFPAGSMSTPPRSVGHHIKMGTPCVLVARFFNGREFVTFSEHALCLVSPQIARLAHDYRHSH